MNEQMPDRTRLMPTAESLVIILKNTHFEDDLLDARFEINMELDLSLDPAVLGFKFRNTSYDFHELISPEAFRNAELGWLHTQPVSIKLQLADPVVTDNLKTREFKLSPEESERLREYLQY